MDGGGGRAHPAIGEEDVQALATVGHELLLEIIPHDLPRALQQAYAAGLRPDWWKLPCPSSAQDWAAIEEIVLENDPHCRGVILLGMESSADALERGFALAARHPLCKGFAVGRTIFMDAARRWFAGRCDDAAVIDEVSNNYAALVSAWRKARSECRESVS